MTSDSSTPFAVDPIAGPIDFQDTFARRHIGSSEADVQAMLEVLGLPSLDALVDQAVPEAIRSEVPLSLPGPVAEHDALAELREMLSKNAVRRSFIGMGYHGTITPPVIGRNILENPGWYTQYTPYQAEISQGRLEALLVFQTLVADLTALPLAGASLLDEATAAAESMAMCHAIARQKKPRFVVDAACHPQTIAVVQTRGQSLGIEVEVGDAAGIDLAAACGVLVQYPTTDGRVIDYSALAGTAHDAGAMLVIAADPLALVLLRPPGEMGADIAVGSMQRFGVPMGFGGPHAGYIATHQRHNRRLPGRIIGVSKDADGALAYRMAIQTREQHIRRERATSNICTAQALLAIMAGMYGVYHGPDGLRRIAKRVRYAKRLLGAALTKAGLEIDPAALFDTLRVHFGKDAGRIKSRAEDAGINLRDFGDGSLGVSLDEAVTREELDALVALLAGDGHTLEAIGIGAEIDIDDAGPMDRTSAILGHPVFHEHRSETQMLRYLYRLQRRDLSLADAMIPLGSCTMKLNATSEMLPVTWPEVALVHPFAPAEQARGYHELFEQLERNLAAITGLSSVSLQPNAGSQGEYAGLAVIGAFHRQRGQGHRDVCLIPTSAHGTNPASAVTAGMKVVPVRCDERGNIDVEDLEAQAKAHRESLAALMITYPSTHGVFEESVKDICAAVHEHGGQVYMDGANLNAQVGVCRPGELGADVCHLNLHKTFAIPHGGGGPGVGPIAVAAHLAPFLPGHPVSPPAHVTEHAIGPISAAPYGSASILPISWMYIRMLGAAGLLRATQVAILHANYMAERLRKSYDVLYTGPGGRVAHEFIIDCRPFEKSARIRIDDIAKRLADYGFHAPTMAWPVPGTLMIEPTESEPRAELDRFCDALIQIREEIREIEDGRADPEDNVLRGAPHTIAACASDTWAHPYSREQAAFPLSSLREHKFWPPVRRVDNTYGDRNLVCTCPPVEADG